jgi:RNA polymerase sigma-70 factor (ECF subfamily)
VDTEGASPVQHSSASPAEEPAVLDLAQAGDRAAFRQLVIQHQARVFGVALRLTGQHADAEELAQDTFMKLHASLRDIRSTAHLLHWLLRTVTHRSIDRIRQRGRRGEHLPLEALGVAEAHAAECVHDPLAAARLHQLLLQLQPDARAVMLLRYQEDLDPTDIAVLLDMPLATIKSHLRRSLEWMRTQCAGGQHGS